MLSFPIALHIKPALAPWEEAAKAGVSFDFAHSTGGYDDYAGVEAALALRDPEPEVEDAAPELDWCEDVRSSRGPTEYRVRHFTDGLMTCECKGYNFRQTCKHLAIATRMHESMEADRARWAAQQEAFDADGEFSGEIAGNVFVFEATPFDAFEGSEQSNEPQPQPRRTAEQARQDYRDLFGSEYEAA